MESQIEAMLTQKNYPCVAALRSFFRQDYLVGFYDEFGTGNDWQALRADLLYFLERVKTTRSPYLTMWAIFPDTASTDEATFERAMWNELSHLTSLESRASDWGDAGPARSEAEGESLPEEMDPSSRSFSLRLGGEALFVVGLHPNASRRGRRFPFTAFVINAFSQFEKLEETGTYGRMVALNRARDEAFHGDANPMSVKHGDAWEAIQFSGRTNDDAWKCPFHFLAQANKKGSNP